MLIYTSLFTVYVEENMHANKKNRKETQKKNTYFYIRRRCSLNCKVIICSHVQETLLDTVGKNAEMLQW